MSRRLVGGILSPRPLGEALPAIYQENPMAMQLVSAFDDILAPAISSLDNMPAYLDPALTPEDFLGWLAGWVGVLLDEKWPEPRRRAFVAVAAELYRKRGTARGLEAQIRIFTAGEVEVIESGASAWSEAPNATLPGTPTYSVEVRVKHPEEPKLQATGAKARAAEQATAREAFATALEALVMTAKPAHVVHSVEIVWS